MRPKERVLTEDGVDRVHSDLILGCIADETLCISESDVRRRRPVTLIIGDDFNAVVLPNSDTRVCRAEINADSWSFFSGHSLTISTQTHTKHTKLTIGNCKRKIERKDSSMNECAARFCENCRERRWAYIEPFLSCLEYSSLISRV